MTRAAATPTRFVSVVGWVFLVAAALGLLISGAQVLLLSQSAPGLPVDGGARAIAIAVVVLSSAAAVVSVAFLRRRRWARVGLSVISALGIAASVAHLLVPSAPMERPPADAPAEYVRLLKLIVIVDTLAPVAACVVLGWILWRLRSPTVREQFR